MNNDPHLSRRGIFRLGGIAGGLLLPFAGGKVLRLADSAAAAAVPVIQSDVPVSPLVQRFRDEAWKMFEVKKTHDNSVSHQSAHYIQSQVMEEAAKAVIAQPVRDFGDLRGLAEVAWLGAPKEELWEGPFRYTGKIYRLSSPPARYGWGAPHGRDWSVAANAALIEGVLELTNGSRFDPGIAHDQWREPRSHAAA